jgi:hypothetical protein
MNGDAPGADDGGTDGGERGTGGDGERSVRADGGRPRRGHSTGDAGDRDGPAVSPYDRSAGTAPPREGTRAPPTTLDESCPVTTAIRAADLGTVERAGRPLDRRYGTERRVRYTNQGTTGRVDVRACRAPVPLDSGFGDALTRQVHRWTTVGDVEGVVPIIDRGEAARPWVVTPATGPTLEGRDTPSIARALRQATQLSGALAALHERGVVHAGLDPGNVAFTLGHDGPPRPVLHNPGLVDVYRRYEDPAAVLDPRYAAPEFFETDRGIVDRTTDVYGLGAVCFRLFTGVAPVAGSAAEIADRVTEDRPLPRPSRVDPRLPDAVDDVVLRATETDKFERYDSARDLHEALVAVRDRLLD